MKVPFTPLMKISQLVPEQLFVLVCPFWFAVCFAETFPVVAAE